MDPNWTWDFFYGLIKYKDPMMELGLLTPF